MIKKRARKETERKIEIEGGRKVKENGEKEKMAK